MSASIPRGVPIAARPSRRAPLPASPKLRPTVAVRLRTRRRCEFYYSRGVEQQQAHLFEVATNGAAGHSEALRDLIVVEGRKVPHLHDADETAIYCRQLAHQIPNRADLIPRGDT